jgi:hypothetical protein
MKMSAIRHLCRSWTFGSIDRMFWVIMALILGLSTWNGEARAQDLIWPIPPKKVPGAGSSVGPTITAFNDRLVLAWKGSDADQTIYWSSSTNGFDWSSRQPVPGAATTYGPSFAVFNNRLFMAWKGKDQDEQIYWSSMNDGSQWSDRKIIPNTGSSIGPALAVFDGQLFAVWKGVKNDDRIYWASTRDGENWSALHGDAQLMVPGARTSDRPSIVGYRNRLFAFWKGSGDDQGIYWSNFDGQAWVLPQKIPGANSAFGPASALLGKRLYVGWKGATTNQINWSSFAWAENGQVPGTIRRPVRSVWYRGKHCSGSPRRAGWMEERMTRKACTLLKPMIRSFMVMPVGGWI